MYGSHSKNQWVKLVEDWATCFSPLAPPPPLFNLPLLKDEDCWILTNPSRQTLHLDGL